MSLTLVAVPIGDPDDITLRAIKELKTAEVILGEESKPLFQLLRSLDIPRPAEVDFLNEHSRDVDLEHFVNLCKTKKVVLVSDCGTPGFCDPGADLVRLCRSQNIPVQSAPGASSLMVLLSLSGIQLEEFYFRGFLPAKKELRSKALQSLKSSQVPTLLMDTPYRFQSCMNELKEHFAERHCVLGVNLTQPQEKIFAGPLKNWKKEQFPEKAEFILILLPANKTKAPARSPRRS